MRCKQAAAERGQENCRWVSEVGEGCGSKEGAYGVPDTKAHNTYSDVHGAHAIAPPSMFA